MTSPQGLTDSQRAILMAIDSVLVQATPGSHVLAAQQIRQLWSEQYSVFQSQLVMRAESWRRRQIKIMHPLPDPNRDCERLMSLLALPGDVSPGVPAPRRTARRGPKQCEVRKIRRPITDAEIERFLDLIEAEGISAVFDPGVSVIDDNLFLPPLLVIDGVGVFYDQIAPAYDRGEVRRQWDASKTPPAWALAADLTLIGMLRERKWTWQIADRYYKRLPWGHPAKTTPIGRPGWKRITGTLSTQRLIERKSSQTWRLTDAGVSVAGFLSDTWGHLGK